jgi:hypothetical protein
MGNLMKRFEARPLVSRIFAFAVLCLWCSQITKAGATPPPLLPGGSQFPAQPNNPPAPGSILLGSVTQPFQSTTLKGTLVSQAFVNDTANPFGPGAITFTYQISLDAGSPNAASQLSVSRFDSFIVAAGFFDINTNEVSPSFISRSQETATIGDVLQFHFGAPGGESLLPGLQSSLLVVDTSATSFQATTASIIDGVAAANINSLAPLAVPEPGAAALTMICLAVFAVTGRHGRLRRTSNKS